MDLTSVLFIAAGAVVVLYTLKKRQLPRLLLSALAGVAAFFATDFLGGFLPLSLPLNAFTIAVSALGGVPGVALLNLLFAVMR